MIGRAAPWATTVGLAASGLTLLAVALYWNQIAMGGRFGHVPSWVEQLNAPFAAVLSTLSLSPVTDIPGTGQALRIQHFLWSWIVATVAYFVAVWIALRRPDPSEQHRYDITVSLAICFRVVLIFSPPLLETDPSRYLWDGAVLAAGHDPYRFAPLTVREHVKRLDRRPMGGAPSTAHRSRDDVTLDALAGLARDPQLSRQLALINHPHIPTCYPPAAQLTFAAAAWVAPGDVLVLKTLLALIDLGSLVLLSSLIRRLGRPRLWILLYAWCPLVLKEQIQTGHFDGLATFFVLAALRTIVASRPLTAGVCLALSILCKLYAGILVVVLSPLLGAAGVAICLLTVLIVTAPFVWINPDLGGGLATYGSEWVRNGSIHALVDGWLLGGAHSKLARVGVGLALAGILLVLARRSLVARKQPDPDGTVGLCSTAMTAMFCLSPVCFPWYGAWLVPYAALQGKIAAVVLSVTMVAYYASFLDLGWRWAPWQGLDIRWLEYAPFYVLLWKEWTSGQEQHGRSLAVVSATDPASHIRDAS